MKLRTLLVMAMLLLTMIGNICYAEQITRYPLSPVKPDLYRVDIKRSPDSGMLIHYMFPENIFDRFAEDVMFLLPLDLALELSSRRDTFVKQSKFAVRSDYWKAYYNREKFDNKKYTDRLSFVIESMRVAKTDADIDYMVKQLALTVQPIFELVNIETNDVTGAFMEFRIRQFISTNHSEYLINYSGYKGESISAIINDMSALKNYNYNDSSLYSLVVSATANLWTAMWRESGHRNMLSVPQNFLVKVADMDLKTSLDLSARIKDYSEWATVANRDILNPDKWRYELVEKRIDDYVRESITKERSDAEGAAIRKLMGLKKPIDVFVGADLGRAISEQQYYFIKLQTKNIIN